MSLKDLYRAINGNDLPVILKLLKLRNGEDLDTALRLAMFRKFARVVKVLEML